MSPFYFKGTLPASKSVLNRLLILQSYEPLLKTLGDSDCDDVLEMRHALSELGSGHKYPIDCGSAGTTFRFFALRASRVPGEHRLTGSDRLMSRPQDELVNILRQLGVEAKFDRNVLVINSRGWSPPKSSLKVDRSQSSQFASSVLLNSWGLGFELSIELTGAVLGEELSEGYLEITEDLVRQVGMNLQRTGNTMTIPARSEIKPQTIRAEIDLSSAFAVAALAAVSGEATITNFPEKSRQPDSVFPQILSAMGVLVQQQGNSLRVARTGTLKPVSWDLGDSPDLFPVLSVLCAFADGVSDLHGAPQLAHKESSRIETTARLLKLLERDVEIKSDGMRIKGRAVSADPHPSEIMFHPDNDHRLAMAAAVAQAAGIPITVTDPSVVNKSFPGFWKLLESRSTARRTLVIGHRGAGKTNFLDRVLQYYNRNEREVEVFDVDAEIEKAKAKSIVDVFNENGESEFRELEIETLQKLIDKTKESAADVYVAVGAGFIGKRPPGWRALWLRRPTDGLGRIFLDRPRLNPDLTPYDEYMRRFRERDQRYRATASEVLTVAEGFESAHPAEEALVLAKARAVGGALTLLPTYFNDPEHVRSILHQRSQMGFWYIELRDDLLSEAQIEAALLNLGPKNILLSFRDFKRLSKSLALLEKHPELSADWSLELGEIPSGVKPKFISLHERKAALEEELLRLSKYEAQGYWLKLAVPIENFSELKLGHDWWQESPETRAFLPSSPEGRWSWYRLLQKPNMRLNFVREGDGSSPDQPLLFDWIRAWPGRKFAAILGDPVLQSRTPAVQDEFFANRSAPVLSIQILENEWDKALEFLQTLGLTWAAVTSPLKEKAFESAEDRTALDEDLKAANTLYWSDKWIAENTDLGGMESAVAGLRIQWPDFDSWTQAIWGGGGTLRAVQQVLPTAVAFSARTAQPRDYRELQNFSPDIVIWAVGRGRWNEGGVQSPPADWKPKVIWDLNYAENSPGREYALATGATYISGWSMFLAQAELQRKFWEDNGG